MRHITSQPSTAASASTPSARREPERISRKWVEAMFCRFARIWPKAWADHLGTVTPNDHADEWAIGLAGLSGEEIGEGIEAARRECPWPPSIAEFRRLATGGATAEQRAFTALARREQEHKALTQGTWQERREKAAQELQGLLQALGAREQNQAEANHGT